MNLLKCFLLILILQIFVGCGHQDDYKPISVYSSENDINGYLGELSKKYSIPGIQISIFNGEFNLSHGFWGTKKNDEISPINSQTVFESASLSKQLFSFVVHELIKQNKLSDTSSIGFIVDENGAANYPNTQNEFIRDLNKYFDCSEEQLALLRKAQVKDILSHQAGFGYWKDPVFNLRKPGYFEYAGDGYIALWRALSLSYDFDSLYTSLITQPLGLNRTFFKEGFDNNSAWGHNDDNEPVRDVWRSKENYPHGSFCSSSLDLGLFFQSIISKTKTDSIYSTWLNPISKVSGYENLHWSKGWGIEYLENDTLVWQWGNDSFYQHLFCYSYKINVGFIYQTNSSNGLEMANSVVKEILGYHNLEMISYFQ